MFPSHRILVVASSLAVLPVVAVGGDRAQLTISGYMPATQRVDTAQVVSPAGSTLVLSAASNNPMACTVTVTTRYSGKANPAHSDPLTVRCDGRLVNVATNSLRLRFGQPHIRSNTKVLQFPHLKGRTNQSLVVTVACD